MAPSQMPRPSLVFYPANLRKSQEKVTKEIKEMIRGNFRGKRYCLRRCKSRQSVTESIPDELLFEVLLRLPAQEIYYAARLVCTHWYHMVRAKDFIQRHLEHASYGLLYRDQFKDVVFISARGGGIHKYKLYYNDPYITVWRSCWNGLMLRVVDDMEARVRYDVVNLSTDKVLRLPRFPYPVFTGVSACGIGYDASSMTYKVVITYRECRKYGCAIFTVGVDKSWRDLSVDHLSLPARKTMYSHPIITEGYMHWNKWSLTEVVILNLETEEIVETSPPIPRAKVIFLEEKTGFIGRSTGRYLTLFLPCGKLTWEVYEMKPKSGEWRKLSDICLEGQKQKIEKLGFDVALLGLKYDDVVPCGWLKYPEMLALRIQEFNIIFYNLTTREIGPERFPICSLFCPITLFKNSLVWF